MTTKNEIHITLTTAALKRQMKRAKVTTKEEYEQLLQKTLDINDNIDDFKLIIKDKK